MSHVRVFMKTNYVRTLNGGAKVTHRAGEFYKVKTADALAMVAAEAIDATGLEGDDASTVAAAISARDLAKLAPPEVAPVADFEDPPTNPGV